MLHLPRRGGWSLRQLSPRNSDVHGRQRVRTIRLGIRSGYRDRIEPRLNWPKGRYSSNWYRVSGLAQPSRGPQQARMKILTADLDPLLRERIRAGLPICALRVRSSTIWSRPIPLRRRANRRDPRDRSGSRRESLPSSGTTCSMPARRDPLDSWSSTVTINSSVPRIVAILSRRRTIAER